MEIYLGLNPTPIVLAESLFLCIKRAAKELYLDPIELPFARIVDAGTTQARVEIDRSIATGNVYIEIIALDTGLN